MITKEESYKQVQVLIERFAEQIDDYKKNNYNETQTRRDFIDPFFKALGWDVDNSAGNAEAYREVIHEAKTMVSDGDSQRLKSPDYAFRLPGGKYLFFVEAKKPSVMIKDDIIPAYQVRRYGWSAKLAVSIITDFEEFAVYDCSVKPAPGDKASTARIKYLRYTDYPENFDFLWDTFSKEKVLKGSFDKFIQNKDSKRGTASVDKEFLASLDKWRTLLATNIAAQNKNLDADELNFAVQQTIDRIIFMRIAEDRGVEEYGTFKAALKSGNYYTNVLKVFREADEKYNSGLFDFKKDTISPNITISNTAIHEIVRELYYPISPYEFSVVSVEILGSAYEQFLGKQITIDERGKAQIEVKPAVRKAGGVYYTPQYIVEYIVGNTVGELCKGKTPKEVELLKIIDPACGSGSFLLGAYGFLLDWHKKYYAENPPAAKKGKDQPLTPDGNLTTALKKRILLNNIYGVDIDVNAVEVTKLSLLLKCLEGETDASIKAQTQLFHERVLPTLDANITCGNSLIGTDYYDSAPDTGDAAKIKPFHWQRAFPDVFKKGGFDAVIGNPPYLSTKRGFAENSFENFYLKKNYETAIQQFDSYSLFIEKALKLLKDKGYWGFIIPKPILTNENMTEVRKLILKSGKIISLCDCGTAFEDANVEAVTICQIKGSNNDLSIKVLKISPEELIETNIINQEIFNSTPNFSFTLGTNDNLEAVLLKIENERIILKDLTNKFLRGIEAGKKDESIKTFAENDNCKKLLRGQDVSRYKIDFKNVFVEVDFKDKSKFKDKSLYEVNKKLLIRRVGSDLQATLDTNSYWNLNTIYNVHLNEEKASYEFILGVFNSKLISFWFKNRFVFEDKLFPYARVSQLERIPIPKIDFKNNPDEAAKHDAIVRHVETLLKLHEEAARETLATRRTQLHDRIAHAEESINALVYGLYGITDEERRAIEGVL